MNVAEWQAHVIAETGKQLAYTLMTTDQDRLDWRPSVDSRSETRSALEQAAECIEFNRRITAVLRQQALPDASDRPFSNVHEATQQVLQSTEELAAAVRELDDTDLVRPYASGTSAMPGGTFLQLAVAHMTYHVGQINFIQTLYGDQEYRLPPPLLPKCAYPDA